MNIVEFGILNPPSMSDWGMNSYLYAPKDDDKHRAYWRELYSLEEATELSQLIKETTSKGVDFIYAISPGLDIVFSNKQEIALLKKKLDQVRYWGGHVPADQWVHTQLIIGCHPPLLYQSSLPISC